MMQREHQSIAACMRVNAALRLERDKLREMLAEVWSVAFHSPDLEDFRKWLRKNTKAIEKAD